MSHPTVVTFAVCCLSLLSTLQAAKPLKFQSGENVRPIIGVMTQVVTDKDQFKHGNIYVPENYVTYLESAGARVVPVLINQTADYYDFLYKSLNGVLFPGGGSKEETLLETGYGKAGMKFYKNALKGYDNNGDYFPLWGTCEGFQLLTMLTSQKDLLTHTNTENMALQLTLAKDYSKSRMFGPKAMPDDILKILSTKNVTYNAHHWSLSIKNYTANDDLKNFYQIISTNFDDHGVQFISTMEAYKYPIYGTQWHPEKNPFQWNIGNIPHDLDAVRVAQHMANFFVQEARQSSHKFPSAVLEAQYLSYNYVPVNIGNIADGIRAFFWTV